MVIINRMYAGSYLKRNIGHEVINTFKADNGIHYIYINPIGWVKTPYDEASTILLVCYHSENVFEIIGYASELECCISKQILGLPAIKRNNEGIAEQIRIIDEDSISYGGVLLSEIYPKSENAGYFTFITKKYRAVKEDVKVYITDNQGKEDLGTNTYYLPNVRFAKESLHMYVDDNKSKNAISELINNDNFWESEDTCPMISPEVDDTAKLLDIIGQADKELVFSNWLAFYLRYDFMFFKAFLNKLLKIEYDSNEPCEIRREYENTDLWIEIENKIIIIENKIKARISVDEKGVSQLTRYYGKAKEKSGEEPSCYLLVPDYWDVDKKIKAEGQGYDEHFTILKYGDVLRFCDSNSSYLPFFEEFKKSIKKHAEESGEGLFPVMQERFIRTIKDRLVCKQKENI